MKKALDYFTDDPSVPLSCTAHCLRCILSRYHKWLQLSLAAWRKETNILFFICLVKHFIRHYKIITFLGQEGVGLETGPSSFACTYHLEPKLPAFVVCLPWKTKRSRFYWWHLLVMGTHTKKKKWFKEIFMFVFKNGHRGAILNVRRQSVGAANVLKLKWGIERRFFDNERNWRDGMVLLRSNFVSLFAR